MAKTQSLSKVQLGHSSLVDHNSQECPRQQVQQQGNEGETLRLKEITSYHFNISEINFLSHLYFQGRGGREGRRSRNVRRGGRTSRSRKGQKLVCTQLKYGDGRYLSL